VARGVVYLIVKWWGFHILQVQILFHCICIKGVSTFWFGHISKEWEFLSKWINKSSIVFKCPESTNLHLNWISLTPTTYMVHHSFCFCYCLLTIFKGRPGKFKEVKRNQWKIREAKGSQGVKGIKAVNELRGSQKKSVEVRLSRILKRAESFEDDEIEASVFM
jgi:hypothetical protein